MVKQIHAYFLPRSISNDWYQRFSLLFCLKSVASTTSFYMVAYVSSHSWPKNYASCSIQTCIDTLMSIVNLLHNIISHFFWYYYPVTSKYYIIFNWKLFLEHIIWSNFCRYLLFNTWPAISNLLLQQFQVLIILSFCSDLRQKFSASCYVCKLIYTCNFLFIFSCNFMTILWKVSTESIGYMHVLAFSILYIQVV